MDTRSGQMVSAQVAIIGVIDDLATANFKLDNGVGFCIKNDGEQALELEVNLSGMEEGVFVKTRFELAWNPEIVREIKKDANLSNYNLKYGY